MADIIHILPDIVANQIAAGEVVLRPSSVIKELVENSVDAGAEHIDVYVHDAGKTLIQVVDDGKGMSETDARMAFERHATSKITKAADVYDLHTMGFRGEALPSIAAVSHVTLRTRQADKQIGTKFSIKGGEYISQEMDVCKAGCNVAVSDLFFNVPARRSGLCNERTELANIIREFERMVLVNPTLSFTFSNNGSETYNLPATNILQRIAGVFDKRIANQLLPVEVDTTLCRITGYVGKPDAARKKGAQQFFFVNGRYMDHPYFRKAVLEAYTGLIPDGHHVSYFLYFDVDPGSIDVNQSPSKTKIEFHNQQAIWQILVAAIKETLGKHNAVPVIDFECTDAPDNIPVFSKDTPLQAAPVVRFDGTFNPFESPRSLAQSSPRATVRPSVSTNLFPTAIVEKSTPAQVQTDTELQPDVELEDDGVQQEIYTGQSLAEMEKSNEYYQYRGQYIVTSIRSGLMLIDQHRAHVRVLYEKYRAAFDGQPSATQGMLFPELLQLSLSDAVVMESILPDLQHLGFDLNPLGGGAYSVSGVPAMLGEVNALTLLQEILDSVRDSGKSVREDVHHRLAMAMAHYAAISVGEVLTRQQMEALVGDLFLTDAPSFAPDGKTVLTVIPQDNIDKMFR